MKKTFSFLMTSLLLACVTAFNLSSQTVMLSITTTSSGPGMTSPGYAQVGAGYDITISAMPNTGCRFVKWVETTSGLGTVFTDNPLTVKMTTNKTFVGYFEVTPTYTLTSTVNGQGIISPASGTYAEGTTLMVTATPAEGYSFTNWSGDLSGTSNPAAIKITANKTITANFVPTTIAWQKNSNKIFYNSGPVGIGTLNPVSNLSFGYQTYSRIALFENTTSSSPGTCFIGIAALPGTGNNGGLGLYGGTGSSLPNSSTAHVIITNFGNVGIGCSTPKVKLAVNGKIQATEVEIKSTPCSDFVFEDDYKLMNLYELEKFLVSNKHLPNIKSANEFKDDGSYNLSEMDNLLLQKVEELTLYVIELKKENDELKARLNKISQ